MKKLLVILLILVAMNVNAQWQPDVRLKYSSGTCNTSYNNAWCIAVSENIVHAIWYDNGDGNYEIYYKRSTDNGITWEAEKRLTNNNANSYYPSIAVSGSIVNVVWFDDRDGNREIYYKRSTDGGINWGTDTRLSNDPSSSALPSIAISGTNLHVVWQDERNNNSEIYYKRSTDGGINWGADTRLTNDTAWSKDPCIAVNGLNVYVVWYDYRDGNYEIYFKRSTDGGTTWGIDTRLTNSSAVSKNPCIAVSGSNVHVVWQENKLFYRQSTDGGVTWGTIIQLTNGPSASEFPSIAVSGSNVHLVWHDFRDLNYEIYYKRSTNSGITWETDTRLTNNPADSYISSIAVSGSNLHVIWCGISVDLVFEINYKRNPTGNVGIQNISTETPAKYSLGQNYPNPFNPTCNVQFSMYKAGQVKLVVYDVQGREVQTLVNEKLSAGTYEVKFDGSMLNSGVYFYKMMTDGFTETKKMTLIK